MKKIKIKKFTTLRLVKSEDLNHHKTLYAGRTAEWFVESGFVAVGSILKPDNIVCVKVHGMYFSKPVIPGDTLCFTSKIVNLGNSSIMVYVKVGKMYEESVIVDGFITFVKVDKNTKPVAHGLELLVENEEDKILVEKAKRIKHNQ